MFVPCMAWKGGAYVKRDSSGAGIARTADACQWLPTMWLLLRSDAAEETRAACTPLAELFVCCVAGTTKLFRGLNPGSTESTPWLVSRSDRERGIDGTEALDIQPPPTPAAERIAGGGGKLSEANEVGAAGVSISEACDVLGRL